MANKEQLELLKKGVEAWNKWRVKNREVRIDFSSANLCLVNLSGADLSSANLSEADLSDADLSSADLSEADLSRAKLHRTNLHGASLGHANFYFADLTFANISSASLTNARLEFAHLDSVDFRHASLDDTYIRDAYLEDADLSGADLRYAHLNRAKLSRADLSRAVLIEADLRSSDLQNVDLGEANLYSANLSEANLYSANLQNANLVSTQALKTLFWEADFTGACIQDWNINASTSLEGAKCDYIYRSYSDYSDAPTDRLPVDLDSKFRAGEFEAWVYTQLKAKQTIDLIFTEGIDWQAFFQSIEGLRKEYPDADVGLQAIENKGTVFVIRLETAPEANKSAIESTQKEIYERRLRELESVYEERLQLQGAHLKDARQAIESERKDKATLIGVLATMANNQQGPTYNLQNAKFGGGFAGDGGRQSGGSITDYSINIQNGEEINQLISSLREIAQIFPEQQKGDALDEIDTLEAELAEADKYEPKRLGRRLKRLAAAGTAVLAVSGSAMTGAVDLSAKVNEFTGNVQELADKLGIELVQPGESEQKSSS